MNVVAIQSSAAGSVTWQAPRNVTILGLASTASSTYFVLSPTTIAGEITTPGSNQIRYDLLTPNVSANASGALFGLSIRLEKGEAITAIMGSAGSAFLYLA